MPTITKLLNAAYDVKETTEAVLAVRAALQELKNTATHAKATIDAAIASRSFASVHADLKTEGQACVAVVNQLVAALGNHAEFVDFIPDQ